MRKHIARLLRRAANRLDPQTPFVFNLPPVPGATITTAGTMTAVTLKRGGTIGP